jgi:transglutaminase-like putative cysteine protease
MRITVDHITRYRFEQDAVYSIQSLRMTPVDFSGQRTVHWNITSEPPSVMSQSQDAFGNVVHCMTIQGPHREMAIKVAGAVDVEDRRGVVHGAPDVAPGRVFLRVTPRTSLTGLLTGLVRPIEPGGHLAFLHELMGNIRDRVDYVPGVTTAETTAAEALALGKGVCQDLTHIFMAAARSVSIPVRYVTGYMLLEGETQADAHHAWAEAWVDGLGWLGFDVANRVCPNDRYVRVAVGLDAWSATPIRGSRRGGGGEKLEVAVHVAQEMIQQ